MAAADLHNQALAQYQKAQHAQAGALFLQAAEAYRDENRPALAAEMQNNYGVACRAQKDYAAALSAIEAAISQLRALDDARRLAHALGNLGSVLLETGALSRAAEALNESLSLLDPQTEKAARSEVLRVLGEVRLKQGKYLEGMADFDAGLRNAEKLSPQQRWLKQLLDRPLKMLGRK